MKTVKSSRLIICFATAGVLACLLADPAMPQDSSLKPTFGSVELTSGFVPDPFTKELIAGGKIQSKIGNVNAWVARAPDFQLDYTAGDLPLTIRAKSEEDTTLLIFLPDGRLGCRR